MNRSFKLVSLLGVLILLSAIAFGQAISGDLTGTVKDASGAYVGKATVEVINSATGYKQTTQTNNEGEYRFVNLPAGHYSITVTATGMKGGLRDIDVTLNKVATANITTQVVSAGTTVEVNEQAVAIDTTTPTISTTFDAKQVSDSPVTSTGNGVLNLSLLDAGVASSGGLGAGSGPSVGGQRPRNNNFTVEGVDNNSLSVTGPLIAVPNDAVDSFTVLQNQYSAEFGHSSGGQFNQTIKSGTNTFHGRAYEYFMNRNLNATDSLNVLAGDTSNPRYDNNRFGGYFGGPIIKNKMFFFTNWEYNPVGQAANGSTACVPTAAGYSTLGTLFSNENFKQFQTYAGAAASASVATTCNIDPKTKQGYLPFAKGIRSTHYDDFTAEAPYFIPAGDVGYIGPNYYNNLTTANSFDWNISQKDSMRVRIIYNKYDGIDTAAQIPAFFTGIPARNWVVTGSEYHNFSSNINNEFRFGYNRNYGIYPSGNIAWPGLTQYPTINTYDSNILLGIDPNSPQGGVQNTYQLVNNLSWVKGKHNLRMGGEFRWYISPQQFTQRARGDYEWNYTSDYFNDFAPDPNAGDFGERSAGYNIYYGNKKAFYLYGNDEWRISPTITLSLGLRYEYTGEPKGVTTSQPLNAISSVPGLVEFTAPTAQKNNILPRIGIAWAPNPDTSVNVGFAMANDVIYDNLGLLSMPPQLQQTNDTVAPGACVSPCPYTEINFIANGGLPNSPKTITDPAVARSLTGSYIPNQTLPYSETWTAGVQHIFANKYTLEVRYVGTRGIHMPTQTRLNRTSPVTADAHLPTYLSAPSQATLDALPYTITACPKGGCPAGLTRLSSSGSLVPYWGAAGFTSNVVSFQPWGASNYNGLQTSFKRNFTNGLQFQAAWTWSHTFDNATADVFSTVLTPRRPQNFSCWACDWGTSALDRRHRITVAATYDLPFFKNSNWMMKNIVGNWQFSPIYTFQSPEYATVQSNADANLNGDSAPDRAAYYIPGNVPNTVSKVTPLTSTRNGVKYTVGYLAVNPQAQYIQAAAGAYATAPRNTLATPDINNWDFAVKKRVNITERQSIEFDLQASNIFNHAQFVPGYISDIGSRGYTSTAVRNALMPTTSFAQWNQVFTNHPRTLVLVLKYDF